MRTPLAAAMLLAGCGYVSDYEAAVDDEEPVYCYQSLAGVTCFDSPHHRDKRRLVNYFGPAPERYDAPEPPPPARLDPPPAVNYYTRDAEPVPRPKPHGDLDDRPWLVSAPDREAAAAADSAPDEPASAILPTRPKTPTSTVPDVASTASIPTLEPVESAQCGGGPAPTPDMFPVPEGAPSYYTSARFAAGGSPMTRAARLAALFLVLMALAPAGATGAEVPVPQNYGNAMRWYQRAAEAGQPRAQFYYGVILEQGVHGTPDPAAAVRWYRAAAEQGYLEAQLRLAALYREGRGVSRDLAESARWFAADADAGSAVARYNLALMYERGWGVARVPARAAALYEQAAEGGIVVARTALAVLYARGIGVDRDPVRAMMWLRLAESAGLAVDPAVAPALAAEMTEAERAEARDLARDWLQRAASGSDAPEAGDDRRR